MLLEQLRTTFLIPTITTNHKTMKPESFFINVDEHELALAESPFLDPNRIDGYKALVVANGKHQGDVVSIVKDTYKVVQNRDLILPFLDDIDSLGVDWKIDPSHSFILPNRMRMQITFPEIYVSDEQSGIPLSLYLHNSYDMSEGVRVFWGAIRSICTNGMVFGEVLGSFYGRHTKGFSFDNIDQQFNQVTDKVTDIQQQIHHLRNTALDKDIMEALQKELGQRRLKSIINTDRVPEKSQWELLNDITYYISHDVEKPKRADFQRKVSKVFSL